jgi:hypothetical protein
MRFLSGVWIVWLAVAHAAAGTIVDVSNQSFIQMNTGDNLYFPVSNLGWLTDPESAEFQFITQSLDPCAEFQAELASPEGSMQLGFSSVETATGVFAGSRYNGPITSLFGTLQFPPGISGQIFENTRATLILHNAGPPIWLGIPGYFLPQDLSLSLTASGSSVSAFTAGALYQNPPPVPEAASWSLLAAGSLILALFLGRREGFMARCAVRKPPHKSNVCKPVGTSDTINLADRKILPLKCCKSNQRSRIIN